LAWLHLPQLLLLDLVLLLLPQQQHMVRLHLLGLQLLEQQLLESQLLQLRLLGAQLLKMGLLGSNLPVLHQLSLQSAGFVLLPHSILPLLVLLQQVLLLLCLCLPQHLLP
jgi:hypothetical protein